MDAEFDALIQLGDDLEKENIPATDIKEKGGKRLSPTRDYAFPDEGNIRKRLCISEVPETPSIVSNSVLHKRVPLHGDYVPITFNDGTRYYIQIPEEEEEGLENVPAFITAGLADQAHILTTNRTLLRWLKAWDSYVFGYSPASLAAGNPRGLQSNITSETTNLQTANRFVPRSDELERIAGDIDPRDGLPRYRIVLLSGPPGVGKTTLAHRLAEHAGYQVIEVNASDDRSVSAFRDQLTAVVSTLSTLDRANSTPAGDSGIHFKPSCLVLDEIDGAVPGAVELLVSAAQALPQAQHQQPTRRTRKRAPLLLRRPVICICNDLYSPAVRPLRAPGVPCLVLKLASLDTGSLVSRLDTIAREEGLSVDKITLANLAEVTNRDIRACLNALQFLKFHRGEQADTQSMAGLDLGSLAGLKGGLKDIQRTLLDAWRLVFTIPPPRLLAFRSSNTTSDQSLRTQFAGSSLRDSDKSLSTRIKYVMETVNSVGEHASLTMGIFENYLQARMKDASLNVARQASDWFAFYDQMSRYIHSHADYSLLRYPVWLPAWFHLRLATPLGLSEKAVRTSGRSVVGGGIRWPTAHNESATARTRCLAVLEQLLVNQWQSFAPVHPSASQGNGRTASLRYLCHRDLLLDLMPNAVSLVSLTALSLRPLNAQLYSQQEKQNLAHLVEVMLSLGLDWRVQQGSEDSVTGDSGEVDYQLEPVSSLQKTVPFTTKQLVARELRLERVRRSEHNIHSKAQRENVTTAISIMPVSAPSPMHLVKSPTAKLPAEDKKIKVVGGVDLDQASQVIYFQFQEGYSNAVRRPVTMKQLI